MNAASRSRLRLSAAFLSASILLGAGGQAAAKDDWNPRPDVGDVIFALPCGQGIAFRRIVTHDAVEQASTTILDDRRIRLGSAEIATAYVDYLRSDFISGNFLIEGRRFFLIGKYEVTAAQYKSLIAGEACSPTADDAIMPASRLSWYDATEFARRLTHHLLTTEREALTRELGTTRAFARLPTETEWEFAARGGLSVSIADFQSERFPMEGDLFAYGWVNDPASAQGEPNPIGLLEPNPVGLHDVYGNLAEMMADSFRMNKAGRSHGLAGAMILKGGSFQSNPNYVTSSGREEGALFDEESGEEERPRTTGFRVALSGPALPTSGDVDRLAEEWTAASRSRLPTVDDPLGLIGRLRESVSDLELSNTLENVEQSVRAEIADSDEESKRLLGGLLLSVGKTISDIRSRYVSVSNRKALIAGELAASLGEAAVARLAGDILEDETEIQDMNYFCHELLVRIVDSFEPGAVDQQAQATAGELRQRNLGEVADAVVIGSAIARGLSTGNGQYTRLDVLRFSLSGL